MPNYTVEFTQSDIERIASYLDTGNKDIEGILIHIATSAKQLQPILDRTKTAMVFTDYHSGLITSTEALSKLFSILGRDCP